MRDASRRHVGDRTERSHARAVDRSERTAGAGGHINVPANHRDGVQAQEGGGWLVEVCLLVFRRAIDDIRVQGVRNAEPSARVDRRHHPTVGRRHLPPVAVEP